MGPTNEALVKLFKADQVYRQAQARYDAAAKNVRMQERRLDELKAKLATTSASLRELQTRAASIDLDIKTRDARIERFRSQQQTAKNNKEYQTFLIEINTEKVDKAKIEDELLKVMEQVEGVQAETTQFAAQVEAESQKLISMREQITQRLDEIKSEVDSLRPARDAAQSGIAVNYVAIYNKLADRFEGEAMAPIMQPDRRAEEYACGSCNMALVVDIYNRLHSRDEVIFCPSCQRMLFIPDDMKPEDSIKQRKQPRKARADKPDAGVDAASETHQANA